MDDTFMQKKVLPKVLGLYLRKFSLMYALHSIQYYQLIIEENFIDEHVKEMNQVKHKNQWNRDCIQKKL